jgi:hypothetical protein
MIHRFFACRAGRKPKDQKNGNQRNFDNGSGFNWWGIFLFVVFTSVVLGVFFFSRRVTATEIKAKIEEALRRSAELDVRRIRVEIDGGTIKLYGCVRSRPESGEAEEAAWSAPGVTKVENYISIEP